MERMLTIDGRQVRFKSSGAFLLRYKQQFGRDAFQDIFKLQKAVRWDKHQKKNILVNINALDLEVFFNLAWTLAKTADPSIPPPMQWLDGFSTFPLNDIMPELMDLIQLSLGSTAELKNQ